MVFFLFGLVKLIFGLPKSEEYLPEGLPGNQFEILRALHSKKAHPNNIHSTQQTSDVFCVPHPTQTSETLQLTSSTVY